MVTVSTKKEEQEIISASDWNFRAVCAGRGVHVGYKEYSAWYSDLFTISQDRLPQLIEILQAMQEAITKSKVQEGK